MARRLLVGLALLLFVASVAGWFLHEAENDDVDGAHVLRDPVERGPDEARLAGRSVPPAETEEAAPPPEEVRRTMRGRLVTADGGRLQTPRAWLIPKGAPGIRSWHDVKARAKVEDDGTWSMEGDPRGNWIGGLAAGYRPTFLDGDAWDGEEVVVRLERSRRIEVTVTVESDGVEPDLFANVSAMVENYYDYPGPGSESKIPTYTYLSGGRHVAVYTSMLQKVRIVVGAKGFVTTPEHVDLEPDEDFAAFRVTQGCRLHLSVLDAETGLPLSAEIDAIARCVGDGRSQDAYRELDYFAETMEYVGLLPGSYQVELMSEDYATWQSDEVRLERPGQKASIEAHLEPKPGRGRLRLELEPPEGGTLEGGVLSVLVGRRGEGGRLEWEPREPHAVRSDRRRCLLAPMVPGDVSLLVWTGPVAVGWVASEPVHLDATRTVPVRLQRGAFARLVPPPRLREMWFPGNVMVQVAAPDGANLPVVWFWSRLPGIPGNRLYYFSSHEYRDERVSDLKQMPRDDAVLGPYPFPTVTLTGAPSELVPNE